MKEEPRLTKWVKNQQNQRGWSLRELARRTGISHSYLSQVLSGRSPPSVNFCKAIARAFDMPTVQVLQIAELIEKEETQKEEDDPIINEIVEEARTLSPENRKQLLTFARFLRGQK